MKKLQADIFGGVYEVEEFEGADMKDEKIFFESLKDCSDDEILCCTVSDGMYDKIKEKYGVGRSA